MLGIFYLKIIEKSERELWRITDYSVLQPVVVNDLFIFSGHKADRSINCDCVYMPQINQRVKLFGLQKKLKNRI